MERLEADWEPGKYRDTYREVLLDIVQRKARGETIVAPERPRPARVVDLVKALEESLRAGRTGPGPAARRRRAAARRGRKAEKRAA